MSSRAWRTRNAARQLAVSLTELHTLLAHLGHPEEFTVRCGDPSCYQWRVQPAGPVLTVASLLSWRARGWVVEADQHNTTATRRYLVADIPPLPTPMAPGAAHDLQTQAPGGTHGDP